MHLGNSSWRTGSLEHQVDSLDWTCLDDLDGGE